MSDLQQFYVTFPSDHAYRRYYVEFKAEGAADVVAAFQRAHGPLPMQIFNGDSFFASPRRLEMRRLAVISPDENGAFVAEVSPLIFSTPLAASNG